MKLILGPTGAVLRVAGSAMLLVALPACVQSQSSARVETLQPAIGVARSEFRRVIGIRELSDGRLIVGDGGNGAVAIVQPSTGSVARLESRSLPGTVGKIIPWRGDSTIVIDRFGRQCAIVSRGGEVTPFEGFAIAELGLDPNVAGIDSMGRLLAWRRSSRSFKASSNPVSQRELVLVRRNGRSIDTVLQDDPVRGVIGAPSLKVLGGRVAAVPNPTIVGAQALLFQDGWVAIAHPSPYSVEWRDPRGRASRTSIGAESIGLDSAERAAVVKRHVGKSVAELVVDDPSDWPETLPPFLEGALTADERGNVLIARTMSARESTAMYDVVDRSGRVTRRLRLNESQRVVGLGQNRVFISTRTPDGKERLAWHPWAR